MMMYVFPFHSSSSGVIEGQPVLNSPPLRVPTYSLLDFTTTALSSQALYDYLVSTIYRTSPRRVLN